MKTIKLLQSITFWPDRIAPYRITMNPGESVFLLLDEGERILISLSENPTAGDSRWITRELVAA